MQTQIYPNVGPILVYNNSTLFRELYWTYQTKIIQRTVLDSSDVQTDYLPVFIGSISLIIKPIHGGCYNFSKLIKSIGVKKDVFVKLYLIFRMENDSSDTSKDSPIVFITASDCRLVSIRISLTIVAAQPKKMCIKQYLVIFA